MTPTQSTHCLLCSQVLTTIAEVQAATSSSALVTVRMQLACAPRLITKGDSSKFLLLKLTDVLGPVTSTPTREGDAGSSDVTVFWTHNAER